MKVRTCFVRVLPDSQPSGILPIGRYTMYYYGPSAVDKDVVIVESLKGDLMTVPKVWVKLI